MATFKIFDRYCCVREDVKLLLAQMYDYQSQNSVVGHAPDRTPD